MAKGILPFADAPRKLRTGLSSSTQIFAGFYQQQRQLSMITYSRAKKKIKK